MSNNIADVLLSELDKHANDIAPAHGHLVMIARKLAEMYKEQQETLASITTLYVKSQNVGDR